MFSGLVQEIGKLTRRRGREIAVEVAGARPKKGDSVAVNGVCLTVVKMKGHGRKKELTFDISPETISRTTLNKLSEGAAVNVERALTLSQSLGGHIVQGHVDGVGRVESVARQGDMKTIWIEAPAEVLEYVVSKGSVTVDGVSLTAVDVDARGFSVALVPFTLEHTTLGNMKPGDPVNLEADIIGKYVAKYLQKK